MEGALLGPGALDPRIIGLGKSATLAIQARSASLREAGRKVYRLGLGQSPFPVPSTVVDALRANAAEKDYLPVEGLRALREAIAEYHRRRNDGITTTDDVIVGPGSKELMFLLQLVLDTEIVIPTPAWVSYAPQARLTGRHISPMHTRREDGYLVLPEQLDEHCRKGGTRARVFLLNGPSNPTGAVYSLEQLQALATVARRHGMVVLSDEIYGELQYDGRHVSMARVFPEGTIVSSGLSKWCGAGGWRLGTFSFPPDLRWLRDAMAAAASETFTSTSAPIQYAAIRAFQGGAPLERYLVGSRAVLKALVPWAAEHLRAAGADVITPTASFYLWVDLSPLRAQLKARGLETSIQIAEALLETTGVATLPGACFMRSPEELTLRLALVDFDGARALSAAMSGDGLPDPEILRSSCHPTTEAIERMADFIRG